MSLPRPRENRPGLGILLALFCFLIFTCMDTIAKWLAGAGYSPLQVAFMRYAFHLTAALIIFLPLEGRDIFRSSRPGLQVIRGLLLLGSTVLNFFAVKYLPLTVTISIFFANPFLVCLLSVPILGERVGRRRLTAIAIGFLGVLVITRPWSAEFHPAMILSLGAVTCASLYFVLTRAVAGADTNATSQLFTAGIATLVLAAPAATAWQAPQAAFDLGLMVLIGIFGFIGHAILTTAYRFAPAPTIAPTVYSQMFYATAIGWLVFAEVPDLQTALGSAIIIGSGLYIWLRERQLGKRPSPLGQQKSATDPAPPPGVTGRGDP